MNQPDKLTRTPLKDDIEHSFKQTQKRATELRNMVNCKCPGNKDAKFREFVGYFDYLFGISSLNKKLNTSIVNSCDKWFDKSNKKATHQNIIIGLALFKKYTYELFETGMIKY